MVEAQVIFSTSKLCCIHFTQESFSSITGRHTLKKDAIPSLVPNYSENISRTCSHNRTVPVVPKKREYGLHKYLSHCVLCKSKKTGVAFFRFPKNENTRKQWIEFCQVDSTRINKTSTLCQYHFTDADFHVSKCGRVSLNENSVPSIREVHPTNCRRNNKNKSPDVRAEERLVDDVNSIIPPKRPKLCSETRRNEGTNSKNKSPDVRAEEIVVDVNPIILPERPELCSETRCDEPTSYTASTSWEDDDISDNVPGITTTILSTSATTMLQLTECFFCKTTSADFIQYRFPNNAAMRSVLMTICGMSPSCLDEMYTVCISHFDDDDIYVASNGEKMIKDRAFPWTYYSEITTRSSINTSPLTTAGARSVEPENAAKPNEIADTPVRVMRKRKSYIGDMSPSDFKSPTTARKNLMFIREKFKATAVKVKQLQDRNRWANRRLRNVLDEIRKVKEKGLISNNVATIVQDFARNYGVLPVSLRLLITRILRKGDNQYLPELRMFALTLSFYSPRTYDFLRKQWMKALPHPSTIRNWYRSINGAPGFTEEAFSALKVKVASAKEKIICNLVIDEVAIRRQLIRQRDKAYGQVDLGLTIPPPVKKCNGKKVEKQDNGMMAKNALVFMFVALNDNFRIPVAYFLVNSLPGRYRANLLQLCLEKAHSIGICISSITFDGASVNFAMCKTLGAVFDLSSPKFDPSIRHPVTQMPIYVFLDPCHAVKLLRNAIGELPHLTDGESHTITWNDVKNLFEFEKLCGLRLGTRLTKQHVLYKQNKMKVKLATQVFSESVAVALQYLHQKKINQFGVCEGTAKFCRMINRAFDILNCRNFVSCRKQPYCKALTSKTRNEIIAWMDEIEQYIRSLRDAKNVPVIESQFERYLGFAGIIICFKNMIRLFDSYHAHGLKFLLSFKLNQDHLETFFSKLRRRGFLNNNPNAIQFQSAYKQLLVNHEIKASERGNCLIDDIPILHVTSTPKQHVVKYDERVEYLMIDDPQDCLIEEEIDDPDELDGKTEEDENYMLNSMYTLQEAEMVVDDLVEYIAGFAVSNLRAKQKLDATCIEILTSPTTANVFLLFKNRGGLCYPSIIVTKACSLLEHEFRKTAPTEITEPNFHRQLIDKTYASVENLFRATSDHFAKEEEHMKVIVTSILDKYLRAKSCHFCNTLTDDTTKRQLLTKNILFSHQ